MGQKSAKTAALWLLSIKNYSKKELFQKLKKKKFSEVEIQEALEKCASWGFLNDEQEASSRLKRLKQKGYGPHLVKLKMKEAGLEFAADLSIEEEKQIIQALLEKSSWKRKTTQQKIAALQRRGFRGETIFSFFRGINF